MAKYRIEDHDLHGTGAEPREVYPMAALYPHDYWGSVTDVPCPVDGCNGTVVWYEAGYVPGFRVCMEQAKGKGDGVYDMGTIKHCFLAGGDVAQPILIRDRDVEEALVKERRE